MEEVYSWVFANWKEIVTAYTALVTAASIIVKWTPTLKDDHALKGLIKFVAKYIALNN